MIEIRFTPQQARGLADAASKDGGRPQLNSIQLRGNTATSTNGHILLQYMLDDVIDEDGKPVTLSEEGRPDLIPELAIHRETMAEAVQYAGRRGQVIIRFNGGKDAEVLAQKAVDKNNVVGFGKAIAPEGQFPDFEQVIPSWPEQHCLEVPDEFKPAPIFTLNFEYLILMTKALGTKRNILTVYVPPDSMAPVVVVRDQSDWRRAFGVIMPARM